MLQLPWRICIVLLSFWTSLAYTLQKTEGRDDDPGLNTFISRPDIRATKWNIKTYHEDLIAPGYWFVGPYRILDQKTFGHGWVGAHIYDQKGELVWSGKDMFSQGNVEDFRISNVNGEYYMTLMDQGRGEVFVFDNHYEVLNTHGWKHFNSHELNYVRNGTRALVIRSYGEEASEEMSAVIGFNGNCQVMFDHLLELDVTNDYETLWEWHTEDHVQLDESTLTEASVENRCTGSKWDYIHTNSADLTDDDDILYSGRHTDTIYKISRKTGEIIWRLGGVKSDFEIDDEFRFSRQHDVRFRGQNDTHLMLSILDNAKGIDHTAPPTHDFSRGLLIAVNEKDMTASIELQLDHPDGPGGYSPRRGNYQVLPNGNIFMGWSEQGVQSEHLPDGTILFESVFAVEWLGTYRQYKFPFVGEPRYPPDIHAEAVGFANGTATTLAWVSWNGATEVASYSLYKTTEDGTQSELLASSGRLGFETVLAHNSFASHVQIEALDKDGAVLDFGKSDIFKTVVHKNVSREAIAEGKQWVYGKSGTSGGLMSRLQSLLENPIAAFFVGFITSAVVMLVAWQARRRGFFGKFKSTRYQRLRQSKEDSAFEQFTDERDDTSFPLRRKQSSDDGA